MLTCGTEVQRDPLLSHGSHQHGQRAGHDAGLPGVRGLLIVQAIKAQPQAGDACAALAYPGRQLVNQVQTALIKVAEAQVSPQVIESRPVQSTAMGH